jgi:putative transcriptional regulator
MRHTAASVRTVRACGVSLLVVALEASIGAQVPSRPFGLPNVPRESTPAVGMLLVASRDLRDPNFVETVIVLTGYGAEGAVGLVLNRRTTVPLTRVFPSLAGGVSPPHVVFQGGPVEVTTAQALRRGPGRPGLGLRVSDDLQVIGTPGGFEAQFADSTDPRVVRVFLGYAGWSAGQLDAEVAAGAWHVFPPDTGVVFDSSPDTLWTRQIRRTEWRSAGGRATAPSPWRRRVLHLQAAQYTLSHKIYCDILPPWPETTTEPMDARALSGNSNAARSS